MGYTKTWMYLDPYGVTCSYLDKFKLSPEIYGRCDPFTFNNFCAAGLWQIFKHWELFLSKLDIFINYML